MVLHCAPTLWKQPVLQQLAFLSDIHKLQRDQSPPSATQADNKQQRGDTQTAQITEICLGERLADLHARRGESVTTCQLVSASVAACSDRFTC